MTQSTIAKPHTGKQNSDNIFCIIYYSDLMSDFIKTKNFKMVNFCSKEIARISESLMEDLK